MSEPSPEFIVRVHEHERIVEVVYPASPTLESFQDYERAVREAVTRVRKPFGCLVDLRCVGLVPPELQAEATALTQWASAQGLRRLARVIKESTLAEMQAQRAFRANGLKDTGVFHTREAAWQDLTSSAQG